MLVWALLFCCIIAGFAIIVTQVSTRDYQTKGYWQLGLLLLMLSGLAIVSLHIIRGYLFYGTDDGLSQLGFVRDIVLAGHVPQYNFYPAVHIFAVQLCQVLGVGEVAALRVMPALLNLLYLIFIYLAAKAILPDKGQAILAVAAGIFVYAATIVYPFPYSLATLLLPLAIFLLVKSCRTEFPRAKLGFRILLLMILIFLPVLHIVPAFVFGLTMVALLIAGKVWHTIKESAVIKGNSLFIVVACLLLLIWSFTWISGFQFIAGKVASNIQALITEPSSAPTLVVPTPGRAPPIPGEPAPIPGEPAPIPGEPAPIPAWLARTNLGPLINDILYASSYGYSVVAQFFKVYGAAAAYIFLAVLCYPVLRRRARANPALRNLLLWYSPLAAYTLAVIILFLSNIPAPPLRFIHPLVMVSTFFVGFALYKLVTGWPGNHKRRQPVLGMYTLIGISFLAVTALGGILSLYPSRYTLIANQQVTRIEFAGMDWLIHEKDISTAFLSYNIVPWRYAHCLLTAEERAGRTDVHARYQYERPPWHFGYGDGARLGDAYSHNRYMALSQRDRLKHEEVYPEMAAFRFYSHDFAQLPTDPTLDRIYSNGGFEVWFVRAQTIR